MPSPADPAKYRRARLDLIGPTTLAVAWAREVLSLSEVSVVTGNCSPMTQRFQKCICHEQLTCGEVQDIIFFIDFFYVLFLPLINLLDLQINPTEIIYHLIRGCFMTHISIISYHFFLKKCNYSFNFTCK